MDGTKSPTSPKSMSDENTQTITLSNNNPGSTIVHVELNIDDQFTFLKAICHKKAFNFEDCQKEYRKLEKTFQSRQGFRLAKCVFTNLMLPMQIDRKVIETHLTTFMEQAMILDNNAFFDKAEFDQLEKIIHFHNKKWINIEKAILFVRDLPLFKRLKISVQEFKEMLPHLKVVEKK